MCIRDRYQDGAVRILDRRKYPTETTYVSCTSVEEVRDAIHDMVTQSGGVKIAAFQALRLHAHQAGGLNSGEEIEGLRHAAQIVANARPTTAPQVMQMLGSIIDKAANMDASLPFAAAVDQAVMEAMNKRYHDFRVIASYIVDQLPDHPRILTHCFAELLIGFVLLIAKERGLCLELICTCLLYTSALFDSILPINPETEWKRVEIGDIPSPIDAPEGCPFSTRCSECTAACGERPVIREVKPGHYVACVKFQKSLSEGVDCKL